MPKSKQMASTGFRKGFLLSSSKRSKKKAPSKPKPRVSSALLDVDQEKSPLLFVSDEQTVTETTTTFSEKKPLHVIISEEDGGDDDLGLTAVSTRRKSPLIQEVSIDDESIKNLQDPFPQEDKKPLLWEVPSKATTTVANHAPKETDAPGIGKPQSIVMEEMISADIHSADEAVYSMSTSQLAHELPNLLWKLKQRRSVKEEQALVQQFVSEHVRHQSGSEWAFIWKFVLKMIAEDSSGRTTPSVRLGIILLRLNGGVDSFLPFLNISNDKHSRVLALGGAILINRFCENTRDEQTPLSNEAWLTQVLPQLSKIVLECPAKRSVLSQQCLTAACEIVAMAVEQKDSLLMKLESTLWDAISILGQLLQVQHGWVEKSIPKAQSSSTDSFSADASRKKCTLAVLSDWRLVVKEVLRLYESIQIDGIEEAGGALSRLAEYTCLQLKGESSDGFEPSGFGGLYQTLSSDPPKLTAAQIVSCMQVGTELMRSMREKKESEEIQSWQRERVRAILRGGAAWLGRSKKHLQSLTKSFSDTGDGVAENTYLRQATDLSMMLLRCDTDEGVALVLTIL